MSKTSKCDRCGCNARGAPTKKPEAQLLRRAVKGVCVNCGIVLFLQRLTNAHVAGTVGSHLPGALKLPHIQEQFEAVMRAGSAEVMPDEIDWDRVIALWDVAPAPRDSLF